MIGIVSEVPTPGPTGSTGGTSSLIQFDLKESVKAKINNIRQIVLEASPIPAVVFHPLTLTTTSASFTPFYNNPDSAIHVSYEVPTPGGTTGGTSRLIQFDLKDTIKAKINTNSREIILEPSPFPAVVFHPLTLTATSAKFTPFYNNPDSLIQVSYEVPTPVGSTGGSYRLIQFDLKDTVKTEINKIKEIRNEPTSATDYIYPVEVSSDIANVLPLQANISNYINVEIKLPPSNGLGRSIQVDLSTYAKGKIDAVRETVSYTHLTLPTKA